MCSWKMAGRWWRRACRGWGHWRRCGGGPDPKDATRYEDVLVARARVIPGYVHHVTHHIEAPVVARRVAAPRREVHVQVLRHRADTRIGVPAIAAVGAGAIPAIEQVVTGVETAVEPEGVYFAVSPHHDHRCDMVAHDACRVVAQARDGTPCLPAIGAFDVHHVCAVGEQVAVVGPRT